MPDERFEGGTAVAQTEWVAEPSEGTTATDPAWNPFSDNVRTVWDGEPDAGTESQRGLGTIDPKGFFNGPEEHEFGFTYDLQQWYTDGSGNVVDAGGAVLLRKADNSIKETHTVVTREEHVDGGADGGGRYIITVGRGGHPGELTIPFETEDGLPVAQELSYQFQKVRSYSISQPSAGTELVVSSSDANDTMDIVLENLDGSTTETVSLNGTTLVSTTSTFAELAAAELSGEPVGDITVAINSGTATSPAEGTGLLTVYGAASYGGIEGDMGVPATGAGSHASTLGTDYVRFNEDSLHYSGPTAIAPEISSGEVSIDNGLDNNTKDESLQRNIHAIQRTTEISGSLAGPAISWNTMVKYLTEEAQTIIWDSSKGTLEFPAARITSPGDITKETDQAKLMSEVTWESEGINVTTA